MNVDLLGKVRRALVVVIVALLFVSTEGFCQDNCRVQVISGQITLDKDAISKADHLTVTPAKEETVRITWLQHNLGGGNGRLVYFQNPILKQTDKVLSWLDKYKLVDAIFIQVTKDQPVILPARITADGIIPLNALRTNKADKKYVL